MAKRKVKPTLTEDEARSILPRRHKRWGQLTQAANKLAEKMKPVKRDVRACLAVLGKPDVEAANVRSKLVEVSLPDKRDERNIELCRSVLSKADFERCCPRVIDTDELRGVNSDLADSLRAKTSVRLEIDFVQEPVARGA